MTLKPSSSYYYSAQQQGIDRRTKGLVVRRCMPFVKGPHVLDLGFVDGMWTDALLTQGHNVDIVEGADEHVERARLQYGKDDRVRIFHALFENFTPAQPYGTVIAGDMLRYLPQPGEFLRRARTWLAASGRLIVTLPNSRSFHRRIGTLLGMEAHPTDANKRDIEVGNLASYDRYQLRDLLQRNGWSVEELRGCFLKPLSSQQMENWSDELLEAFLEIGDELEDYCWFMYAVCRPYEA